VRIAGALLAAGAASRLGRPKGLLRFRGRSFVRRLADELAAVACPVVVVVAPGDDAAARELAGAAVETAVNPRPERGLGSSLAAAVEAVRRRVPEADALLVALVDQPLADRALFAALADAARRTGWAACDYGDGEGGPPAVLPRAAFDELARLTGDRGARDLLRREGARVDRVPFPGGRFDVDTPGDYARLPGAGDGDEA